MTFSRRTQENLLAGLLLLTFIGFFYLSLGYSPRSRLVPLPIAVLGIVLSTAQLIWQNFRRNTDLSIDVLDFVAGHEKHTAVLEEEAAQAEAGTPAPATGWKARLMKSEAGAFGILAALIGAFLVLGPLPAVFLFTLFYLVLSRQCSPVRGAVYAVLCTGILYLMFDVVLGVEMNRGLAAPLFESLGI
jgi:hypothetical protein